MRCWFLVQTTEYYGDNDDCFCFIPERAVPLEPSRQIMENYLNWIQPCLESIGSFKRACGSTPQFSENLDCDHCLHEQYLIITQFPIILRYDYCCKCGSKIPMNGEFLDEFKYPIAKYDSNL